MLLPVADFRNIIHTFGIPYIGHIYDFQHSVSIIYYVRVLNLILKSLYSLQTISSVD